MVQEDKLFPEEYKVRAQKPDFKLEIPKDLTVEIYYKMLHKIFAVIRYKVYSEIRKIVREEGRS